MRFITALKNSPMWCATAILRFVLTHIASRHGKRLVFISSLYIHVIHIERLRDAAISKLNKIMRLSTDESVIRLSAVACNAVWAGTALTEELNAELMDADLDPVETLEISKKVVSMAPKFIRYAREEDMVADVMTLIQNGSRLAQVA